MSAPGSQMGAGMAVAAVAAMLLAPPASADVVFDPVDAEGLAAELAEATAAQDVCYGWTVRIDDQGSGVDSGVSTGSSFGAGVSLQDPPARSCTTLVEFVADITYTGESSESADSARFAVISIPSGPTTEDLEDLDLVDSGALTGEEVDDAVGRAVTALPRLAAEAGIAPPLIAEPQSSAPPDVGGLSDDPGSDYLRRAGGLLAFGAVLLVGGVAFAIFAAVTARRQYTVPQAAAPFDHREPGGPYAPPGPPLGGPDPGPPSPPPR